MGIQHLEVRGNSSLAISQINGDFDAKDLKMVAYRNTVLKMSARFEGLEFHHVAVKVIKRQMSSLALAPSATPSHLTSFWKGSSSHPWCGKGKAAILIRI